MNILTILRWTGGFSAIATLQAIIFATATSVEAAVGKPFRVCAEELQEAGVSPEEASTACSDALAPKDLSLCVKSMNEQVGISAEVALNNCYRDRRPIELATCVVEIDRYIETDNIAAIVDNCRKSVLPFRYSECVVGLITTVGEEITPSRALDDCIAAENLPLNGN